MRVLLAVCALWPVAAVAQEEHPAATAMGVVESCLAETRAERARFPWAVEAGDPDFDAWVAAENAETACILLPAEICPIMSEPDACWAQADALMRADLEVSVAALPAQIEANRLIQRRYGQFQDRAAAGFPADPAFCAQAFHDQDLAECLFLGLVQEVMVARGWLRRLTDAGQL